MSALRALPDTPLHPQRALGRRFIERGAASFRAAAAHVHRLPYGRTSPPDAHDRVLVEGRGTCSGKHALLAALAREHALEVQLMLGLFEMTEANTPGTGAALARHGLPAVPEAHCYLRSAGERVDLTHPGSDGRCALHLLCQVPITPEQAGAYKRAWHREQMTRWAAERGRDVELVWRAREQCILALSGHAPAAAEGRPETQRAPRP